MSTDWNARCARRMEWMTTSIIREILEVAQSPDVISMAGGWPEADLFPVEQLDEVCHHVLTHTPRESLQYGLTGGFPPLRQALAEYMTQLGVPAKMENVVITSGSQQALDLMGRIFLEEGDTVLVENPTFLGALQSFKAYGVKFAGVPVGEDGLDVDELEELLDTTHPKFMYLIPNFQNPSGVTTSLERRVKVVGVADRMGVPILEDDPYGVLRFEGEHVPSLIALDSARFPENAQAGGYVKGNVVYLSTFSKTLAPGLRVAWAVCPPEIGQRFVMAKQGADLHTNSLAQTIAYEFIRRGWLPGQIRRIRETYRQRRDAMCEAIAAHFPEQVRYTRPQGGLFLWVTLPDEIDAVDLLEDAAKLNVAFVPGSPFFVDGSGTNTLRLCFASVPPQVIREGIRRLGAAIEARLD